MSTGNNRGYRSFKPPYLFALLFLLLAPPLFCQQRPVLGTLPLGGIAVSQADVRTVSSQLENSFVLTGVYSVITAQHRDEILGSGEAAQCTDEDCAAEIGKKLEADQMVLGTVSFTEGRYIINARIIAVSNARTLAADSISAGGREELEQACNTLAVDLTRRAVPGSLVEQMAESEEEEAQAEAAEEGSAGEAGGGGQVPAPETEGETAVLPETSPGLTRADRWPMLTIGGGVFFLELGNVMGSVGFELQRKRADTAGDDSGVTFGYYFTTSLSYFSWSAAAASVPTYLLAFPDRAFQLSRRGRILFAGGAALSVAGNVLDLLAGAQRYRNDFLYEDYLSAGTDIDELYDRYNRGHILYTVERITSYSFWLVGGGAMVGAFFLHGPREQPISGFWEKTMLVGGMTLVGLGSVTRTLALNYRQDHVESGGDEKDYDRYVLNSVLSYSFWAVGSLGIILPFVADIGPHEREAQEQQPAGKPRPEQLRVLPAPGGVILQIAY